MFHFLLQSQAEKSPWCAGRDSEEGIDVLPARECSQGAGEEEEENPCCHMKAGETLLRSSCLQSGLQPRPRGWIWTSLCCCGDCKDVEDARRIIHR